MVTLSGDLAQYAGRTFQNTYDDLCKITALRPGFTAIANQVEAVNRGGFLLPGKLTVAENLATGESEKIYRDFSGVTRIVYDENKVPIAAIEINKNPVGGNFDAFVLAPGETNTVQVASNGVRSHYNDQNFYDRFDFREYCPSK